MALGAALPLSTVAANTINAIKPDLTRIRALDPDVVVVADDDAMLTLRTQIDKTTNFTPFKLLHMPAPYGSPEELPKATPTTPASVASSKGPNLVTPAGGSGRSNSSDSHARLQDPNYEVHIRGTPAYQRPEKVSQKFKKVLGNIDNAWTDIAKNDFVCCWLYEQDQLSKIDLSTVPSWTLGVVREKIGDHVVVLINKRLPFDMKRDHRDTEWENSKRRVRRLSVLRNSGPHNSGRVVEDPPQTPSTFWGWSRDRMTRPGKAGVLSRYQSTRSDPQPPNHIIGYQE
eukprot:1183168-Prorocentrum_minimum.AAC.1